MSFNKKYSNFNKKYIYIIIFYFNNKVNLYSRYETKLDQVFINTFFIIYFYFFSYAFRFSSFT